MSGARTPHLGWLAPTTLVRKPHLHWWFRGCIATPTWYVFTMPYQLLAHTPKAPRGVVTIQIARIDDRILADIPEGVPVSTYVAGLVRRDLDHPGPQVPMGRLMLGEWTARLSVSLPRDLRLALDLRRGSVSISEYLRGLIRGARVQVEPERKAKDLGVGPGPGPTPTLPRIRPPLKPALTRRPAGR